MSPKYPIMDFYPEQRIGHEPLGSKKKFWFLVKGNQGGTHWLIKFPRKNTGEHWAEKIAYEVACKLSIFVPKVELAVFNDDSGLQCRGMATENFIPDKFYELLHGNQILASIYKYNTYNPAQQSMHTVERIFTSMGLFMPFYDDIYRTELAGYLVLDALIGNTDRHHENWGIIRRTVDKDRYDRLAPTFDHASSLGRELTDSNRKRYLNELGIHKYASRAHGAVFIDENAKRAPSPVDLVKRCLELKEYRKFFRIALRKLNAFRKDDIVEIVSKIPDDWMSDTARQFTIEFVRYNLEQLRGVVR